MFKNNVKFDFEFVNICTFDEKLLLNLKKHKEINIFT